MHLRLIEHSTLDYMFDTVIKHDIDKKVFGQVVSFYNSHNLYGIPEVVDRTMVVRLSSPSTSGKKNSKEYNIIAYAQGGMLNKQFEAVKIELQYYSRNIINLSYNTDYTSLKPDLETILGIHWANRGGIKSLDDVFKVMCINKKQVGGKTIMYDSDIILTKKIGAEIRQPSYMKITLDDSCWDNKDISSDHILTTDVRIRI